MPALHQLVGVELHVVAQVVKAKFIVGAVGDILGVFDFALLVIKTMHDNACAQAKEFIQLAHPGRVTLGEVVVDRDHMHALARQGIEHHGQGRHKGFAFTGLHFGYLALVQHHAADELHVIVTHAQSAA